MEQTIQELQKKVEEAIQLASDSMSFSGEHHKAWYIDQIVRVLAGDKYPEIVNEAKKDENGEETQVWEEGVQP